MTDQECIVFGARLQGFESGDPVVAIQAGEEVIAIVDQILHDQRPRFGDADHQLFGRFGIELDFIGKSHAINDFFTSADAAFGDAGVFDRWGFSFAQEPHQCRQRAIVDIGLHFGGDSGGGDEGAIDKLIGTREVIGVSVR